MCNKFTGKNIEFRIHCLYLRKNKERSQGCGESGKWRGIIELDVLTTKGFYGGWRVLLEIKNNEIGVQNEDISEWGFF